MPHHTDHPDVREVKGKGRVVLGCMNSLSLRARTPFVVVLGPDVAGLWRAWHARGVQAH